MAMRLRSSLPTRLAQEKQLAPQKEALPLKASLSFSFSSISESTFGLESEWRKGDVKSRLTHALVKGIVDHIDADTEEARRMTKITQPREE